MTIDKLIALCCFEKEHLIHRTDSQSKKVAPVSEENNRLNSKL
jgi:hypothetical protein